MNVGPSEWVCGPRWLSSGFGFGQVCGKASILPGNSHSHTPTLEQAGFYCTPVCLCVCVFFSMSVYRTIRLPATSEPVGMSHIINSASGAQKNPSGLWIQFSCPQRAVDKAQWETKRLIILFGAQHWHHGNTSSPALAVCLWPSWFSLQIAQKSLGHIGKTSDEDANAILLLSFYDAAVHAS